MFNFDDLRRQCDEYIAKARRQGQELLAEAAATARRDPPPGPCRRARRRPARGTRRRCNSSSIAQPPKSPRRRRRNTCRRSCRPSRRPPRHCTSNATAGWPLGNRRREAQCRIAEKILRHELARRPELALAIIREALQLAAGQPYLRSASTPPGHRVLQESGKEAVGCLAGVARRQPGPRRNHNTRRLPIETQHGVIDARLETQLERITSELLEGHMTALAEQVRRILPVALSGSVSRIVGLTVSVTGFPRRWGRFAPSAGESGAPIRGEVVGFRDDETLLLPYGDLAGIRRGNRGDARAIGARDSRRGAAAGPRSRRAGPLRGQPAGPRACRTGSACRPRRPRPCSVRESTPR